MKGPKVTEAFAMRSRGESWTTIARMLGTSRSGAVAVITNESYLGIAKGPNGARKEGAHSALVTRKVFDAVQPDELLHPRDGSIAAEALLGGLVKCAGCGHTLSLVGRPGKGPVSYYCRKHHAAGDCPAPAAIECRRLDTWVDNELQMAIVKGVPEVIALVERSEAFEDAEVEVEAAQAELDAFIEIASALNDRELFVKGVDARKAVLSMARRKQRELRPVEQVGDPDRMVTLEEYLRLDRRMQFRRMIESVTVAKSDPKRRRWQPTAERAEIRWRGAAPGS